MIEILKAIVFGIVEGITEWLPISSTGHMILLDEIMPLDVSPEFKEMFLVVIQLGAILAVVLMFWKKLWPFGITFEGYERKLLVRKPTIDLWLKVIVAVLPAAVLGLFLDDFLEEKFYNFITVAVTLIVYGILFIIVEKRNKNKKPKINTLGELDYKTALIIGVFQVLALIPGTSRSGATILGAILIGTSRKVAAEFTFFLAIPVMFGASLLKLIKLGFAFSTLEFFVLLTGMITAFLVSIFAIKFLMNFIKKHDFKAFGIYRIILGVIVIIYFLATK